MLWLIAAVLSAFFAGITSILAKCGINKTDSDVAAFIRTAVVLLFSFIMAVISGAISGLVTISIKSLIFLILSGISTGASWICYFKALSIGNVNKVVPIDKASTVITVLMAIILFGETKNIVFKLISTVFIATGIFLMIEKKEISYKSTKKSWFYYAVLSALFASLTTVLAKVGIENIESDLATFVRTAVVLVMSYAVLLIKGKRKLITEINRKEFYFIFFSGIATGISWLLYYYAIKKGIVSVVVPIDKLSIIVSMIFSAFVFKEKFSKRSIAGVFIMSLGTLLMAFVS